MEGYSPNNPSVKRILREMKEMEKDTSHEYSARALEVLPSVHQSFSIFFFFSFFCIHLFVAPLGNRFVPRGTNVCNLLCDVCANPHRDVRPTQDNIFEWHFTVRGPSGTPFEGGVYHGRILLPAEYPFKPPNIVWLTVRHLGPFGCTRLSCACRVSCRVCVCGSHALVRL